MAEAVSSIDEGLVADVDSAAGDGLAVEGAAVEELPADGARLPKVLMDGAEGGEESCILLFGGIIWVVGACGVGG